MRPYLIACCSEGRSTFRTSSRAPGRFLHYYRSPPMIADVAPCDGRFVPVRASAGKNAIFAPVQAPTVTTRVAPVQGLAATTALAPVQGLAATTALAPVQGLAATTALAPVQGLAATTGLAPVQGLAATTGLAPVQGLAATTGLAPVHTPPPTTAPTREQKKRARITGPFSFVASIFMERKP